MATMQSASWVPCLAGVGTLAACGFSGGSDAAPGPTPPALVVGSIQPAPFLAYHETQFTITGSGFTRANSNGPVGPTSIPTGTAGGTLGEVIVTFRTDDGAPFANGTSSTAQVVGTVVSDTQIQGASPMTNGTGIWPCTIEVSDALGHAVSAMPIAAFAGLTVFDIDHPEIPADQATQFEVFGLAFPPALGTCTVRFTSVGPGTFPGGAMTLDVPGNIDDLSHVSGVTPALALTQRVRAFVTVILDNEPGAPQATSSSEITAFVPPPLVPVVVSTITTPLQLAQPTPFTITGSGFLGTALDPTVEVEFTAATAPFGVGSTQVAIVPGTATTDTTVVGTAPTGTSTVDVNAFVRVIRDDDVAGTSATAIALFQAPSASVIHGEAGFAPTILVTTLAVGFTITGTNLPASQTATVRFRAIEGTPFTGGTTETVDVTANVTSTTQIDGTSPLATATAPYLAEVTVILQGGVLLPMGVACSFVPPGAASTTTCVVTNLADSGTGSLRQAILDAVPGCVITFDPSLSGNLDVDSTIVVAQSVNVLGPGPDVIRVRAQDNDYEVFRIEPGATNAIIEELSIRSSHHRGDGGAFVVRGGLTLVRCELADHDITGAGAGVFVADGATATLEECEVRNSSADQQGAGVFTAGGAVQVTACTFSDNSCKQGGAAIATDTHSTVQVVNSTFFRNSATEGPGGGAILIAPNSTVSLLHCTLAENNTHNRGGGALVQGTLIATNCIFARNSDGKGEPEIANKNGTNDTTFSLVRVGTGSDLTNGVNGNLVGSPNDPVEADLGPLQLNGGPTRTMELRPNSPALNAATASSATKDQRAIARPQGPAPDMGAFESTVNF